MKTSSRAAPRDQFPRLSKTRRLESKNMTKSQKERFAEVLYLYSVSCSSPEEAAAEIERLMTITPTQRKREYAILIKL